MAFIDIPNAKKRDEIVQNYLSTITQVQQRNEDEKASNLKKQKFLEKTFEPIVRATEKSTVAITEELKKKKEKEEEGVEFLSHYLSLDKKILDNYFGIQRKADGSLVMGKTKITTIGSKITIDDKTFETTPGLWSLIMLNNPQGYTSDDYAVYRDIVELTDVVNNPQNVGNGRPDQTNKYKLLEKLYWGEGQEEQEGEGILEDVMRKQFPGIVGYGIEFLPGDIQGLLSKLGLLLAEFKAGNYNTRNQIVAILDELKRRKQLTNKKYKEINTFLSKGTGFPGLTPGFFHQYNEDTVGARAVRQALNETK